MNELLHWFAGTVPYKLALGFVAGYPIVTGVMWTLTSLIFYRRNERVPLPAPPDEELPEISVVVAAYCEEAVIERTLRSLVALDYPRYEVIIVDDGSTDRTPEILRAAAARRDPAAREEGQRGQRGGAQRRDPDHARRHRLHRRRRHPAAAGHTAPSRRALRAWPRC